MRALTLAPTAGMAVVMAACALLLGLLATWQRLSAPPAELTRKAGHVGMGLIALSLPALFDDTWPVLVLCAGLGLAFLALQRFGRHSALGRAIHGVDRTSAGDLYFAASVAALWLLSAGDRLLFVVPVLVLTLGDAVAALVGMRYGQIRFDGRATGKSLEGSAALLVVTFLSVHLPLTLWSRVAPLEGILMAATMGVIVTLLEAVAWRGLDNVFVPIGAFLLLRAWLPLDAAALAGRLALILVLIGLVLAVRARTTLRDAALAGAALFGYLVWTLGGWQWAVAPLVLFVAYHALFPPARGPDARAHDMHAVAGVVAPALVWLFAGSAATLPHALVPYTATFVAQLAMIGLVHASAHAPGGGAARVLATILKGALVVLPAIALHRPFAQVPAAAGLALAGAMLAAVAFNRGLDGVNGRLHDDPQWRRQGRWALAASLATLPIVFG